MYICMYTARVNMCMCPYTCIYVYAHTCTCVCVWSIPLTPWPSRYSITMSWTNTHCIFDKYTNWRILVFLPCYKNSLYFLLVKRHSWELRGKLWSHFFLKEIVHPHLLTTRCTVRHCARLFAGLIFSILTTPSWVDYYYVHFTNKEPEAQRKHAPNPRGVSQSEGCGPGPPFFLPYCLSVGVLVNSVTGNRAVWKWSYNPGTTMPQLYSYCHSNSMSGEQQTQWNYLIERCPCLANQVGSEYLGINLSICIYQCVKFGKVLQVNLMFPTTHT